MIQERIEVFWSHLGESAGCIMPIFIELYKYFNVSDGNNIQQVEEERVDAVEWEEGDLHRSKLWDIMDQI